jgi:hypothetical protein
LTLQQLDPLEKVEYLAFRITLLILFVAGLLRIIKHELSWLVKRRRK